MCTGSMFHMYTAATWQERPPTVEKHTEETSTVTADANCSLCGEGIR